MGALAKMKQAVAEEIPGLAEAETKAAELQGKYFDLRERIGQAQADLASAEGRRGGLLAQAKAGEVIGVAEVAEAEAAVRTAEQALMLLREAAPAVLKRAQDAASEVMSVACEPVRQQAQAAKDRYDAAVEACRKADAARSAAWSEHDRLQRWSVAAGGPGQMEKYAPAVASRKAQIAMLLDEDQKAASTAFWRAQREAQIKADARARCEQDIRRDFMFQGRMLTPDELERQLAARGHG